MSGKESESGGSARMLPDRTSVGPFENLHIPIGMMI